MGRQWQRRDDSTNGPVEMEYFNDSQSVNNTKETRIQYGMILEWSPNLLEALRVLEFLETYYIPLMISLGLVGNFLSFVAFFFTHLKRRSSSYYLGSLAATDFGYLCCLLIVWLSKKGIDVTSRNGWCQIIVYLSTSFSCCSVWLIVGFTAERLVAVNYPFWRLNFPTTQRAQYAVAWIAMFSFALNTYLFWFVGITKRPGGSNVCDIVGGDEKIRIMSIINYVDTCFTLALPVMLIIGMNSMIARALCHFYSQRRMESVQDDHSKTEITFSSTSDGQDRSMPQATQVNIARMLLLVSTTFITLNLPSYIIRIYGFILEMSSDSLVPLPREIVVLQAYFMILFYTNFAINFLVYNISSRMFRRVLKEFVSKTVKWFCVRCAVKRSTSSDNSSFVA